MRMFPIIVSSSKGPCPSSIPWEVIAPYDGQAQINHQQSLERLAERGGLSPVEAYFVMHGRRWRREDFTDALEIEACAFLDKIVRDRRELETKLRTMETRLEVVRLAADKLREAIFTEASSEPIRAAWHELAKAIQGVTT